jgi:glycine/sarcosine N-methyltransferase
MTDSALAFYNHLADSYHLRVVLRTELADILQEAGFRDVFWYMPEDSGYYQPIVTARV